MACGAAIGVGCVLPGVSGGVIAISMGLYEKMLSAIKNLLRSFKENFIYLLPIGIGCVIGILLTSNVLKAVIDKYEAELFALFCGFVLGSLPTLFEETRVDGKIPFSAKNIIIMVVTFALVILLEVLDANATAEVQAAGNETLSPLSAILAGAILAIGVVIPGLSSSFLLVYFGTYKPILVAIAEIRIPTLFFAGIGFALSAGLLILLMHFVLERFHIPAYFAIIGMAVGTMALILPNIIAGFSWLCIPLCVLGIAVGIYQSKKQIEKKRQSSLA